MVVNVTAAGVGTAYATGGGNQGHRSRSEASGGVRQSTGEPAAHRPGHRRRHPVHPDHPAEGSVRGHLRRRRRLPDRPVRRRLLGPADLDRRVLDTHSVPAGSGPRQPSAGPDKTIWSRSIRRIESRRSKAWLRRRPRPPSPRHPCHGDVPEAAPHPDLPIHVVARPVRRSSAGFWRKGNDRGAWRTCTAPKRYKVKPGRFRFQVRATAGGVTDPTPGAGSRA